jgi:hypothetical protein
MNSVLCVFNRLSKKAMSMHFSSRNDESVFLESLRCLCIAADTLTTLEVRYLCIDSCRSWFLLHLITQLSRKYVFCLCFVSLQRSFYDWNYRITRTITLISVTALKSVIFMLKINK